MDKENGVFTQPGGGCRMKNDKSPFGLPEKESECYRKLILVLLKILQPDFKTSDDTVLEKMLDFMRTQGDCSRTDFEVLSRILSEWLKKVTESWAGLSTETKLFALKVAAYVASSSSGYCKLSSSGTLAALFSFLKDSKDANSSSLTLGFICLMEAVMSTEAGAKLVIDSGLWKDVTLMATSSPSIYCLRQSTKLLALIIRTADESIGEAVFQDLTAQCPVNVSLTHRGDTRVLSVFNANGIGSRMAVSAADVATVKTMDLCRAIVSLLMDADYPVQKIMHLLRCCHLTDWAWNVLEMSNNKQVLDAANRFVCMLIGLNFYQTKDENGLIPFLVSQDITDLILKQISILTTRQIVEIVADACMETYKYLIKYGAAVAGDKEREPHGKEVENIPFCIHNVLFCFQALPMLLVVKARSGTCWNYLLEEFIDKMFRITNSKVMRSAYSYRDHMCQLDETQLCSLATSSLHRFVSLAPTMCKEQAVLLFQSLTYLLYEFVAEPQDSSSIRAVTKWRIEGEELILAFPKFLSVTVNCLYTYLNRFDFSWRDSLESLTLLSILQKLLESRSVPPWITVDVLKTIDVALVKFMPPNLALLVDTIQGSSTEDLGPQLYKLMHSKEWVVKDSTLETVKTIASLSESRFPAFQTLLIDNKLPELAFSIIESDPEPFVRRSAITCLHEIAKVPPVWNATLADKNVVEKLLSTLLHETEGIVRVEAAKMISTIYKENLCPNEVELIYDTMSYVALNDFHWEVKLNCLEFYHSVMAKCIGQQGMIDGMFPDAVFSKEKKKIIKLTPDEIKNRCIAAFNDLATNGCLQVLWTLFSEEEDFAVQKKAAELIWKIESSPRLYSADWRGPLKREGLPKVTENETAVQNGHSSRAETQTSIDSDMDVSEIGSLSLVADDIIDQIVAEADVDLLGNLVHNPPTWRGFPPPKRKIMTALEFLEELKPVDVMQVVANRSRWLAETSEGMSSLLDDILLFSSKSAPVGGSSERNAVDCY